MRLLVVPLIVLSLGFAPAPLPKPMKPRPADMDMAALQGSWLETNSSRVVYLFVGKKVTVTQSGTLCSNWVMSLDTAKTPKAMDLAGDGGTVGTIPYKYRLEGDTLTLILGKDNRVFKRQR
jgi:uncharacterized protein (TIGR03067 family)